MKTNISIKIPKGLTEEREVDDLVVGKIVKNSGSLYLF